MTRRTLVGVRADVVLVRHAEPYLPRPGGPDDYGRGLTARGHEQAQALVVDLVDPRPAAVVSSPYLRAVQTVAPTARTLDLAVLSDPLLREWDSGLEARPDYADHYALSWADPDFTRPGGESLAELSARAVGALRALALRFAGGTVVVGSHGTFIARAPAGFGVAVDWPLCRAMPMPARYRLTFAGDRVHASGPGLHPLDRAERGS